MVSASLMAQVSPSTIAVEKILRLVAPARQLVDRRAKALLGEIEITGNRRLRLLHAVAIKQLQHAARADGVGGELRVEIAHALVRRARVEQDDVDHIAIHLARAHDAHRRDADAFLIDRLAHRRFRARHHAADVGVMRDVGDERDDFFAGEHRRDDVDVGQMRAAAVVRIVGDEHVAGQDVSHAESA